MLTHIHTHSKTLDSRLAPSPSSYKCSQTLLPITHLLTHNLPPHIRNSHIHFAPTHPSHTHTFLSTRTQTWKHAHEMGKAHKNRDRQTGRSKTHAHTPVQTRGPPDCKAVRAAVAPQCVAPGHISPPPTEWVSLCVSLTQCQISPQGPSGSSYHTRSCIRPQAVPSQASEKRPVK